MIVIAGAGLAGLSAAYHLQENEQVVVFDKEDSPGGLCRSVESDGFTFDLTGHLLHLRRPEIKALVENIIAPERFVRIDRRSFVYSHGTFTPYPFQVNTHGLPAWVVSECLTGFVEAIRAGEVAADEIADLSFKQWVLRTFGAGIAEHFMFPYNEKLWLTDLEEITCDWVSWSIPRPTVREVVDGALGNSRKAFGYNPSFLYPKQGGIRILPEALAARIDGIHYRTEITGVDAVRRAVTLGSGEEVDYDHLISTIPLPRLLAMTTGMPEDLIAAARRLRHVAVVNINLGIDRVIHPDKHWVYFPDRDFVFYRAGFPASFTPAAAPAGCSSIYLEIAVRPG
ncbi:MAG: protoporphyrinogen/coproporphyrinogen oxidase, partial [Acidobacteriota bacterium]